MELKLALEVEPELRRVKTYCVHGVYHTDAGLVSPAPEGLANDFLACRKEHLWKGIWPTYHRHTHCGLEDILAEGVTMKCPESKTAPQPFLNPCHPRPGRRCPVATSVARDEGDRPKT